MDKLYTIGCEHRTPKGLLKLLRRHQVSCIVDARSNPDDAAKKEFTPNRLKAFLQKNAILYLPFTQEFGHFPQECFDASGNLIYDKAILAKSFLHGIERLRNGMAKGFTIAIMGESIQPTECHRFSVIGHYLYHNGLSQILHIIKDYTVRNQGSLEAELSKQKPEAKLRTSEAREMHNELGKWGEDIAAAYLQDHGFTILERNWHYRQREIDIIALNTQTQVLSFVEVKTRRNDHFGLPEQAVTQKKMWFLAIAAGNYLRQHALRFNAQFDIIAITGTPETGHTIRYIPDAIPPSARATFR